jgi:hypothetical protein
MSRIIYTLRQCGLITTARKAVRTVSRYGFTSTRILDNLQMYSDFFKKYGITGNIFIPAKCVQENYHFFKNHDLQNIRLGVHGYVHIDYSTVPLDIQDIHFRKSYEVFTSLGIEDVGFRAPYGRLCKNSIKILASIGYKFDSSRVFVFKEAISDNREVRSAIQHYDQVSTNGPTYQQRLPCLPFTLPDDELLVERMGCNAKEALSIWCEMIHQMSSLNNLIVLQIHPNRLRELSGTLESIVKIAMSENIEITDILSFLRKYEYKGSHIKKRYLCITGDIDAISLRELV